ncbi:MAG: hypothetical protein IAF38_11540 [Bacteroidia bacterium]|nr:hypothetical protein [Bacteroidia bacterium]
MRISIVFFSLLLFFGCSNSPKVKVETVPFTPPAIDSQTVGINLEDQTDTAGITKDLGIEFGFCNSKGDKVLLMSEDSLLKAAKFTKLVSYNYLLDDIKFVGRKKPTEQDNDRQTEYNFENCGGYLYDLKNETATPENSQVLLTENFLSNRKILPEIVEKYNTADLTKLKGELRMRIEKDKGRKIKKSLRIRRTGEQEIYLVEFALKKDSALAVLVYLNKSKFIYLDFSAKFDATSTWRVDDGGDFGMDYFKVLAVFECDGKIEIVTDWHGAEGVVTTYYREENGKFVEVKTESRYTAPL